MNPLTYFEPIEEGDPRTGCECTYPPYDCNEPVTWLVDYRETGWLGEAVCDLHRREMIDDIRFPVTPTSPFPRNQ